MSPHAGFVLVNQVLPRLKSAVPRAASTVGAEDAEELVQDATAMAAKLMESVEKAGKKVTPGNIAYYAIQHIKSGRRSTRSSNADAYGSCAQLNGRSRLDSLEQVVASNEETGGEIFLLHDVLTNDHEDPSMAVARKMDWEQFVAGLSKRERTAVEFLAEGGTLRRAARSLGLSDSALQTTRRSLVGAIREFMGEDILLEVQRRPQWKEGLEATREKLACRHRRVMA